MPNTLNNNPEIDIPSQVDEFVVKIESAKDPNIKAIMARLKLIADNIEDNRVKEILESQGDFLRNLIIDSATAKESRALAEDFLSKQENGEIAYNLKQYIYRVGNLLYREFNEELIQSLQNKEALNTNEENIEIESSEARDDDKTLQIDIKKRKPLSIDDYNPDGDYDSPEEIPPFPGEIMGNSELYEKKSLEELADEIKENEDFLANKIKENEGNDKYQPSEIVLIRLEWKKRYYNARLRIDKKIKEDEQKRKKLILDTSDDEPFSTEESIEESLQQAVEESSGQNADTSSAQTTEPPFRVSFMTDEPDEQVNKTPSEAPDAINDVLNMDNEEEPEKDARNYALKIRELVKDGDLEGAWALSEEALDKHPHSEVLYIESADIAEKMGNSTIALELNAILLELTKDENIKRLTQARIKRLEEIITASNEDEDKEIERVAEEDEKNTDIESDEASETPSDDVQDLDLDNISDLDLDLLDGDDEDEEVDTKISPPPLPINQNPTDPEDMDGNKTVEITSAQAKRILETKPTVYADTDDNTEEDITECDDLIIEENDISAENKPITKEITMLEMGEKLIVEEDHTKLLVALKGDSITVGPNGILTIDILNPGANIEVEEGGVLIVNQRIEENK